MGELIELYPRQTFGPDEMRAWFHKLAEHLDVQLDGPPTGMLVVVLNDEEIRVWSAGPLEIRDEAALAAKDALDHRRWPLMYDTPEVLRATRRANQRAREEETPWVCTLCSSRMKTAAALREHYAVGHRCMTCQEVYYRVEEWQAHPCMVPDVETPVRLTLLPQEGIR